MKVASFIFCFVDMFYAGNVLFIDYTERSSLVNLVPIGINGLFDSMNTFDNGTVLNFPPKIILKNSRF